MSDHELKLRQLGIYRPRNKRRPRITLTLPQAAVLIYACGVIAGLAFATITNLIQ